MRVALLAVVPFLLGLVSANYYVDCDDGKGNHEKYNKEMQENEYSECRKFYHGMKNFDCYQDDEKNYRFEYYEDDKCKGKKHEHEHKNKKKNEHKKYKEDNNCWSYRVYCEGEGDGEDD
ncbi:hypothetical protein LTR28_005518 [Elasticomyces elasticus]|nr:hypothetical protein LTR28_005518 [Elasticomyces elasticus]